MSTLDTYANANRNSGILFAAAYPANNSVIYQSFTTPNDGQNYKLTSATVMMEKMGSSTGTFQMEIYAHTGTYGTTSAPTGSALATSNEVADTAITLDSFADVTFTFSGANQIILTPNTHYVFAVKMLTASAAAYFAIGVDSSSPTHAGNAGTWTSA